MEDWRFSSFAEYMNFEEKSICNKTLATEMLDLRPESFYNDSYKVILRKNSKNLKENLKADEIKKS